MDGVGALGGQGPVGWRLHALTGKRPLQAILEVRTRRRPFDLAVSAQRVAEAALDQTTIIVGHDHQPVRLQRVEVEVEPTWGGRLTPVVEALRCDRRAPTRDAVQIRGWAAGRRPACATATRPGDRGVRT